MKRMAESLTIAAEIREKLEGRQHSDSTELVREDRSFNDEALSEGDGMLEKLISDVTEENRQPEIDFGSPIGKEEW